MRKLKSRASNDLQQNVYQNRTQFIKISKEAEKLKSEMRALRNLMSDLKTNTTALRSAANNADSSSFGGEFSTGLSKRDKRSSVADRTALWSSQMQVSLQLLELCLGTGCSHEYYRLCIKTSRGRRNSSQTPQAVMSFKTPDPGSNWTTPPTSLGGPCRSSSLTTTS